jgi:hypothetical protein
MDAVDVASSWGWAGLWSASGALQAARPAVSANIEQKLTTLREEAIRWIIGVLPRNSGWFD